MYFHGISYDSWDGSKILFVSYHTHFFIVWRVTPPPFPWNSLWAAAILGEPEGGYNNRPGSQQKYLLSSSKISIACAGERVTPGGAAPTNLKLA